MRNQNYLVIIFIKSLAGENKCHIFWWLRLFNLSLTENHKSYGNRTETTNK